ncbi:MAG: hypothetical protein B6I20_02235 [Bacteroidetes bacterium 4572_117]|nr:MAG: hypothetical protein B6I20_02235 [Bacteroidetes bacterium 4572_117]
MENRFVTIATLKNADAELLKKQLFEDNIESQLSEAKAVKASELDGFRVKVKEKDRKQAIQILEIFSEAYGIETMEGDTFSREIERILVPVDFSENSNNACQYALGIAEKLHSEIILMHSYFFPVINSIDYGDGLSYVVNINDTVTEISDKAKHNMLRLYNDLNNQIKDNKLKNIELNFTITNGNPTNEIINLYNKYRPDLIIMGTRGNSVGKHGHFGSVSATTIRETIIPVLAIPEVSKYRGIGRTNVMYVTNFDESDYKALKKLMTLVYSFDIKIHLVNICERDTGKVEKIEHLKTVFNNLYPGYELECHIIDNDNVTKSIEAFVASKSIDIIAMTTHKRNFITRLFYPSTTKKVLFQTNTPLLVFHA